MSHVDIVQRIHDAEPASTWQSADGMLGFVLRVIAALPANEKAGLVKAPQGGENVAHYAPSDHWVRVNRVAYADGTLAKILLNSGVGGANTPAWNESADDPGLYLEVDAPHVDPPASDPPVPPAPVVDLSELIAAVRAVRETVIALGHELDTLKDQIQELVSKPDPTATLPPWPSYSGKIPYLGTVTLTPKS